MKKIFITSILIFALFFQANILKAQNTGPVAPEAMSFEPVDATDMVNLATGDMSYVIPLIDIPGPEGGYPLGLSYHGGVAFDQEATWVGLGWNINPGAINRSINGVPDDWDSQKRYEYIYINGSTTTVNYFNISLPINLINKALPSIGLNFTWGDYRSFGGSIGYMGMGFNTNGSVSMGFPSKRMGGCVGLNFTAEGISVGLNYSVSGNLFSAKGEGGLSFGQKLADSELSVGLGISLSTNNGINGGLSMPVGSEGFSSTISKNDANISVSGTGINLFIASWGKMVTHSWIYKEIGKNVYGSLYTKNSYIPDKDDDLYQSKDDLMDLNTIYRSYESFLEPEKKDINDNMFLPATDQYNVSAQGISGRIKPRFESITNIVDEEFNDVDNSKQYRYRLNFNTLTQNSNIAEDLNFYFDGENVTDFVVNDFTINPDLSDEVINKGDLPFRSYDSNYYNERSNRQITGNFVEWFSNKEIQEANPLSNNSIYQKGFIETDNLLGARIDNYLFPEKGIGAFAITSPDGKTYHYSLPVYQFEEFIKNYDKSNKINFSEQRRFDPYAYTWLLTAITGPDYIDRGGIDNKPNGIIDDNDWGYWVKFDYGKWTDSYIWQLPAVNPYKEKPYHTGRKQIYYLNSVQTKTHIAYFIKSLREDGKGSDGSGYTIISNHEQYLKDENKNAAFCLNSLSNDRVINQITLTDNYHVDIINHPVFKLDKILIGKKDNLSLTNGSGDGQKMGSLYSKYHFYNARIKCNDLFIDRDEDVIAINRDFYGEYNKNILEISDLPSVYTNNILGEIDFFYDYSLNNKLTLKSFTKKGLKGTVYTPPYIFSYISTSIGVQDNWGYNASSISDDSPKPDADNWSLTSIQTPVGTKIDVNYESDTYVKEVVFNGCLKNKKNINTTIIKTSTNNLEINISGIYEKIYNILIKGEGVLTWLESNNYANSSSFKSSNYIEIPYQQDILTGVVSFVIDIDLLKVAYDNAISPPVKGSTLKVYSFKIIDLVFKVDNNSEKYGGGLRVKSIKTTDPSNENNFETEYTYRNGLTPYAYHDYNFFIPYFTELPNPCVIYSEVDVKNKSNGIYTDEVTTYKFQNFDDLIDIRIPQYQYEIEHINQKPENASWFAYCKQNETSTITGRKAYNVQIVDGLKLIGSLKEKTIKNSQGHEILKTKNIFKKGNVIQESYVTNKDCYIDGNLTKNSFCSSKITQNYVLDYTVESSNGRTARKEYTRYDPITGNVLETKSIGINGDEVQTSITPAYLKYPKMGSKVYDINNKNMLTQEAASYTEKWINNAWKPIGASVQTWSNNWNYYDYSGSRSGETPTEQSQMIWRKYQNYTWRGSLENDGSLLGFSAFNFSDQTQNTNWVKTNQITKYNHYSTPLEAFDIQGVYSIVQTNNNNQVIANTSNASFFESRYCSFEENSIGDTYEGGFWATPQVVPVYRRKDENLGISAHTGDYYLEISNGQGVNLTLPVTTSYDTENGLKVGRDYQISFWVHNSTKNNIKIVFGSNGEVILTADASDMKEVTMGDWCQKTYRFSLNSGYSNIQIMFYGITKVYIDDVRVKPLQSTMNSYVYNCNGGVAAILDNNNFAVKYEYDEAGRLIRTLKETPNGFKKVSVNAYKYKRSKYVNGFVWNPQTLFPTSTVTFTANDAGTGATYTWDIDGTTEYGQTITHTYSNDNTYSNVTLIVQDADNITETIIKTINFYYMRFGAEIQDAAPGDVIHLNWESYLPIGEEVDIALINPACTTYPVNNFATVVDLNTFDWTIPTDDSDFIGNSCKIRITQRNSGYYIESNLFNIRN
jgi:YD repeat-containing protein